MQTRGLCVLLLALCAACSDSSGDGSLLGFGGGDSAANGRLADHAPSVEGIYTLDAYTLNEAGCDSEGDDALDTLSDTHAFAIVSEFFGISSLDIYSCADPTDCRDKADTIRSMSGGFGLELHFAFGEADDADHYTGGVAWTGSEREAGTCSGGRVEEHTLVRDGESLRIENRVTPSRDYPADEEGFCWTDASMEAAEGEPCGELEVVELTFLEDL